MSPSRTVSLAMSFAVAACGAARGAGPPPSLAQPPLPAPAITAPSPATKAPAGTCPASSADTRVAAEEVEQGAALVFTRSEEIPELRRRVAELTLPNAPQKEPPRTDNIHQGIRLIFETENQTAVNALRQTVRAHARQIAEQCGLVLTEPPAWPSREARPAAVASEKKTDKAGKPKSKDEAKLKKPEADKKKKDAGKPAPKADTKPKSDAPKKPPETPENDKIKDKGKGKPPIPRLPGAPPEPLPGPTRS